MECAYPECGWQSLAATDAVAKRLYAEHVVEEHADSVDADIPEGKVQVKREGDDEWTTTTVEEARDIHEEIHD